MRTDIVLSMTKARCYIVIAPLRLLACLLACLLALEWQKSWRLSIPFYEYLQKYYTILSPALQWLYYDYEYKDFPCFRGTFQGPHVLASNSSVVTLEIFAGPQARKNACWGAPQTRRTSGQSASKQSPVTFPECSFSPALPVRAAVSLSSRPAGP